MKTPITNLALSRNLHLPFSSPLSGRRGSANFLAKHARLVQAENWARVPQTQPLGIER
jgi:hypothetical protein